MKGMAADVNTVRLEPTLLDVWQGHGSRVSVNETDLAREISSMISVVSIQ
jgi:hypothetical protein